MLPQSSNLEEALGGLESHEHLCLLYETPKEWRTAIIPFLTIGLKRGEKCLYIVDTHTANQVRSYLRQEGVDVPTVEASGQLVILPATEAYTREGSFDPDRMITLLIAETEKALAEGYPALRASGEMSWALHSYPGSEKLLEYESKLNRDFLSSYPCVTLCLYDRRKFNPEITKGVIMTHPLLVQGNHIYRNSYYLPTEEFLSPKWAEHEIDLLLKAIAELETLETQSSQAEELSRELFYSSPSGLYLIQDGKFQLISPEFQKVMGYSRDELLGMDSLGLVLPEDRNMVRENVVKMLKEERLSPHEYRIVTKGGEVRWVVETVTSTHYQGRRATLGNFIDITERKQAEEEVKQSWEKLRGTLNDTVNALASIAEKRDPYTAGHQRRVAQLAYAIAKEMGLPQEQVEGLRVAGILHDIGKIYIPAEILSKPGKISGYEFSIIKTHPQVGYDIVREIKFPWPVAQVILQHHERLDGSGYPDGLSGKDIILEARILAVADVVEAMASHRPHRPALGIDEALKEISQNRGILYDPEVIDACLKLFIEEGFKFE